VFCLVVPAYKWCEGAFGRKARVIAVPSLSRCCVRTAGVARGILSLVDRNFVIYGRFCILCPGPDVSFRYDCGRGPWFGTVWAKHLPFSRTSTLLQRRAHRLLEHFFQPGYCPFCLVLLLSLSYELVSEIEIRHPHRVFFSSHGLPRFYVLSRLAVLVGI